MSKSDRRVFNHPIRESTTLEFYPDKFSLEEFKEFIKSSIEPYCQNMKHIGINEFYIEEWFESFMCWNEVEEER